MTLNLAYTIVQYLLGLLLTVFATNALFLKLFSPKIPPKGAALMDAMRASGYLLTFIQATELVVGVLLLSGYFVPGALIVLMPISINIFLFHLFLAPPVFGPGVMILAMNAFLLSKHIDLLRPFLEP